MFLAVCSMIAAPQRSASYEWSANYKPCILLLDLQGLQSFNMAGPTVGVGSTIRIEICRPQDFNCCFTADFGPEINRNGWKPINFGLQGCLGRILERLIWDDNQDIYIKHTGPGGFSVGTVKLYIGDPYTHE